MKRISIFGLLFLSLSSIAQQVDVLITQGTVFDGSNSEPKQQDIALQGNMIVAIGENLASQYQAITVIDAKGKWVAPGFIDPHTHSLGDLKKPFSSANLNYLTQGVTTVFNGNDGGGPVNIKQLSKELLSHGIGTNTALFVGHGSVRKQVMGKAKRAPSADELTQMKQLVKKGMEEGAFGLSAGLYYVPGNYSDTEEVIELAKVIAPYQGVYESHLRDESSYNIGVVASVAEAIEIGEKASVATHIGHIKALGVDVWGHSKEIVRLVEQARKKGHKVTADQYPWQASGTSIKNALFPRWVLADSNKHFISRIEDPKLIKQIREQVKENIRRRGGAESLLLTADTKAKWRGKTLAEVAEMMAVDPVTAAFKVQLQGGSRIASFNMSLDDIDNFMQQPWTMTSSDGSKGHPRKFASYPEKYQQFVNKRPVISLADFIHRSTGLVADTFGVNKRGYIKQHYYADVVVIDPDHYQPNANYANPEKLTTGVDHVFVNGQHVINQGKYLGKKSGYVLRKSNQQ